MRAVLPVRVRGKEASGVLFETLAHTLDLTCTGARLGAMRRPLAPHDTLTIFYHQYRIEFVVMWSRLLGKNEYQVGLQSLSPENNPWGLHVGKSEMQPLARVSSHGAA